VIRHDGPRVALEAGNSRLLADGVGSVGNCGQLCSLQVASYQFLGNTFLPLPWFSFLSSFFSEVLLS